MSDYTGEEARSKSTPLTAEAILKSPTLLYDCGMMIERLGVVGEGKLSRLIYLVLTSRIQERPLSMTIKGESAGGKSYLLGRILNLMPPDAVRLLADATTQSFLYLKDQDLDHKIVVFAELPGMAKTSYSVRLLQSEGHLRIQVTVRDPETGEQVVKENEVKAHVGFITTTTSLQIELENETRQISAFIDESESQTGRILTSIGERYATARQPISKEELAAWVEAQRRLVAYPVVIPFARELARLFPSRPMRVRRDFERMLVLIETICLMHQEQRLGGEKGGRKHLVASIADYHLAKILAEEVLVQTVYGIPPQVEKLLRCARELGKSAFSIYDLMAAAQQNYDVTFKWLKTAVDEGFVEVVDPGGGRRRGSYKLTSKILPSAGIMPPTEKLYEACPLNGNGEWIYDPLSGERLVLKKE